MLFSNQFVNARLLVETLRGPLVVPLSAVQRGTDSTFVYVVEPDSTVAIRPVTVGPSQGDSVTITTGLALDDLVVSDGIDKLFNEGEGRRAGAGSHATRRAADSGGNSRQGRRPCAGP